MNSNDISSICVFCGSSSGNDPSFLSAARKFGQTLANMNIELIYGGGKVGLMGAVADATLEANGKVVGVMPQHLVDREIAHSELTRLVTVKSMHERKTMMADYADAFLVLPGGAGTLEEAFEQWTWVQLGIHQKPLAFFNVNSYFNPLLAMIDQMVDMEFLSAAYRDMLIIANDPEYIVEKFKSFVPPIRKNYEKLG